MIVSRPRGPVGVSAAFPFILWGGTRVSIVCDGWPHFCGDSNELAFRLYPGRELAGERHDRLHYFASAIVDCCPIGKTCLGASAVQLPKLHDAVARPIAKVKEMRLPSQDFEQDASARLVIEDSRIGHFLGNSPEVAARTDLERFISTGRTKGPRCRGYRLYKNSGNLSSIPAGVCFRATQ